jgi:hypothetical protein
VQDKKASAEIKRLGCDYDIKIWFHQTEEGFDSAPPNAPAAAGPDTLIPGQATSHIPDLIYYELRKAGEEKLLARGSAPPKTFSHHTLKFNPYPAFSDQIVKKLNR